MQKAHSGSQVYGKQSPSEYTTHIIKNDPIKVPSSPHPSFFLMRQGGRESIERAQIE